MLRVFLSDATDPDRAVPWVRYAPDGRILARGSDAPARWPADPRIEVVLAAQRVRLIALTLPPMAGERLLAAVRFALEDQIATPTEEAALALGEAANGTRVVAVAAQPLVDALAQLPRVARIVPESALAPNGEGWTWCRSQAGGGFVRREDGSAFSVGDVQEREGALPAELAAALAHAARGGTPKVVRVAFTCSAAELARWSNASGARFVEGRAWSWPQAAPDAFAAAPDFLQRRRATRAMPAASGAFRPALVLASLAVLVHVGALVGQWAWLTAANWRVSRALVAQAEASGATHASSPTDAALAIARHNAELRHRAGQNAPTDALPLLARSAAALGALPAGAVRSARYVDNAWTLELAKLDPVVLSRVTHALGVAGVDAVAAATPGGSRMRMSLGALAR
jgi:type II secretion system protein L